MVIMTFTFSRSFSQPEGLDLRWEECYEDIYWFFGVVVWKIIHELFSLNHFQFIRALWSSFILLYKK